MKIPLKAITVTYTRTLTVSPTTEMFEDWDVEPSQQEFESYALNELFDVIHEDVSGYGSPMPYTNVEKSETVEIDWEDDEDDD